MDVSFVALLEVGVFVVDVQGRRDALRDQARPTSAAGDGLSLELASKDQLHLFGAAQIHVLPDDFLEEGTTVEAPVPDLGEGKLGLEDRQVVTVTGPAVAGAKRVRQAAQPLAEERVDLLRESVRMAEGSNISEALPHWKQTVVRSSREKRLAASTTRSRSWARYDSRASASNKSRP